MTPSFPRNGVSGLAGAVHTAILYGVAGLIMINGAIGTPGYAPGEGVEYEITLFGAAVTAFVAAQLGIALGATETTQGGQDQNLVARLDRDLRATVR